MRAAPGGLLKRARQNDRITLRGAKPRSQANRLAMLMEPVRASRQVPLVLRLGRHAGKTHVIAQFTDESGLVLLEIFQHLLHADVCIRRQLTRQRPTSASLPPIARACSKNRLGGETPPVHFKTRIFS